MLPFASKFVTIQVDVKFCVNYHILRRNTSTHPFQDHHIVRMFTLLHLIVHLYVSVCVCLCLSASVCLSGCLSAVSLSPSNISTTGNNLTEIIVSAKKDLESIREQLITNKLSLNVAAKSFPKSLGILR